MPTTSTNLKSFTDLIAWQEGHKLVLSIYRFSSALPDSEKFGLASQMQRAAVSITSNIAEGFARQSPKEQLQFFFMALGSTKELQNQLLICRDLEILGSASFKVLANQSVSVSQLLHGLIKSTKRRSP